MSTYAFSSKVPGEIFSERRIVVPKTVARIAIAKLGLKNISAEKLQKWLTIKITKNGIAILWANEKFNAVDKTFKSLLTAEDVEILGKQELIIKFNINNGEYRYRYTYNFKRDPELYIPEEEENAKKD